MGGMLSGIEPSYDQTVLSTKILPQYGVLTGCIIHSGTLVEIRRLYERFRSSNSSTHHIPLADFTVVTRNSPIEGLSDAYLAFGIGASKAINILEFLCLLVIYASSMWEFKVLFLMRLFDFDSDKCLAHDEVTILCSAVLNGFAVVTGLQRLQTAQLTAVSNEVFRTADINPDGLLTCDEYLTK